MKKLNMGKTLLDKETVLEYIEGMKEVYRAEKYNLLEFNCMYYTLIIYSLHDMTGELLT